MINTRGDYFNKYLVKELGREKALKKVQIENAQALLTTKEVLKILAYRPYANNQQQQQEKTRHKKLNLNLQLKQN